MFRAVPMMWLEAVILAHDERAVLWNLGKMEAVQLSRGEYGSGEEGLSPADYSGALARCDRLLSRIRELRQALNVPLMPGDDAGPDHESGKDQGRAPSVDAILRYAEENLGLMEERTEGLVELRQNLLQRQKELLIVHDQMSRYRGHEIPLDGLDRYSFLHFVTGSLPSQNIAGLAQDVGENVAVVPLDQQKGRQSILAMTTIQNASALEKVLQQVGFQRDVLPVVEGTTVDGLSKEEEKELEQLAQELKELNGKLGLIGEELRQSLAETERVVNAECHLLMASQQFARTDTTVLIEGWVPSSSVGALGQKVREITGGKCALRIAEPDSSKEQEIPVLLKHSPLLRPFEMLVSTYGLPSYRETVPTLFVAISYILMFGLMFGDAGHGLVLIACGLYALIRGSSVRIRDVGVLLIFAGSSSALFGIIYGSYFGIEAFKKFALWHDPLDADPMKLMYGAMVIGISMISLGLILNVINRLRRRDVIGAILDKFGLVGILFYWGALVLLLKGAAIQAQGLMGAALVLFLAVPIVGWALKEPLEHVLSRKKGGGHGAEGGMATALVESCVGAFEAILSYLANTISFVRLAAYAMSHAALLFAAFMLAAEVRDFPYGGSVWSVVVIILGNLVAIVLEGIIASVQALRLEYYEFFGKFFSGGGQPFEPFRLGTNNDRSPP